MNKNKKQVNYICPFCNTEIKSSKKTDIYYRNDWIKGCNNCFVLSIDVQTVVSFQKNDHFLV